MPYRQHALLGKILQTHMSSHSATPSVNLTTGHPENGELDRQSGGIKGGLRSCVVKIENLARKRPLVFAVALVTLLFATVIWAMPPAYQTNDDAIMNMIAAGQIITLEPDEHLFCTNVIIGKLLKSLYVSYPDIHWYGWYLVTTQWVATIALLYCFLQPNFNRARVLCFMAYFLTAGVVFLVHLQFTTTGSLSGFAGVMLLLQLLRTPSGQRGRKILLSAAAGSFLIWSGLIRSETFMLTLLLACPVFLVVYWLGNTSRRTGMAVCCVLGLALCSLFLASKYNREAYREPGWESFYQYAHSYFVKFFDMGMIQHTPETKYVFDQVGWSENDAEMMLYSFYYDDPIYDAQNLKSILTGHPWMQERNYGELLSQTLTNVIDHRTIQMILCCLPFLLFFFDRSQRRYWPCAVAFVMAAAILPALVFMRKAPPERVFVPVIAFPWLILLSSLALQCGDASQKLSQKIQSLKTSWQFRNWSWSHPGWSKHLLLRTITLLLVIGMIWNERKQYRLGKDNVRNAVHYEKMLADMRSKTIDSERLVLAFIRNFPMEYHPPLFKGSDYKGMHIYCACWAQRSPVAENMKKHFNVTSLSQALADRNDTLLITNEKSRSILRRYLAEHYSKSFKIVNLKHYPRGSLAKLQPNPYSSDKLGKESAGLSAKPNLDPKKSR